jgi:uracil-DNA glycosylase
MTMTREDALRELELLPVWQLRAPSLMQDVVQIAAEKVVANAVIETAVIETAPPVIAITQKADVDVETYQSENSAWVFVCSVSRMDAASQSMLLNNIFAALQIKPKKYDGDLVAIQAKVIVAMGEKVAQALLNTQESLTYLRGKMHTMANSKLIASDDLAHLLANPQHKAKLWQDLCLARDHIKSLD